jgi:hypothetical protein
MGNRKEDRLRQIVLVLAWVLGVFFTWGGLHAQDTFCPQVASYFMDVTLDTGQNLITGKEWVTWTNTSDVPALELWFHLYWNAFQNNRSTFLTESSQRGYRLAEFGPEDWGFCRIDSLQVIESQEFEASDLTPRIRFRQPDDGNPFDQTVCSVRLPQPVAPGQTLDLVISFESKVPKPISRTGVYRQYYFIAQWFPKLGVFQNGVWNCHQYHNFSEYFADYGTYDVKITLPSTFQIEATGEHREQTSNGDGTSTHRFNQHSVHDFAWVASPDLFRFTEDYPFVPGKTTRITLLLQPYHRKLKDRYLDAVKNAVRYASLRFGDYPYSTITCVDPAYNSRSGGMEYPTFFTGGAYFLSPEGVHSPEGVTIHEFGHGYFYGLLGSNEFEHAWMDEGMTSFLDTIITYTAYGEPKFSRRFFGIPVAYSQIRIPIESAGISNHRQNFDRDDMQRPAWHYMDGGSYGANAYSKAQLLMLTLRRYMGEALFDRMIKTYSTRWWWKHPEPQDFYDAVSEFAGEDMSWFLDQVVYGSGSMDYAVGGINNRAADEQEGLFGGDYKDGTPRSTRAREYTAEILVRRIGEVKAPVRIRVWFADDHTVDETWDGQYRWKKLIYRSASPITRVVVDPDFIYVLDINRSNNSWTAAPDRVAPWKWAAVWLHWLQHALEMLTILGG